MHILGEVGSLKCAFANGDKNFLDGESNSPKDITFLAAGISVLFMANSNTLPIITLPCSFASDAEEELH